MTTASFSPRRSLGCLLLIGAALSGGCARATEGSSTAPKAMPRLPPIAFDASLGDASSDATGGPSESVVVRAANGGRFNVENRGVTAVSLSSTVSVEREDGTHWLPTNVRFVALTERCGDPVPPCVELAPGTVFSAVPWDGHVCSGQCQRTCRSNHPVAPGIYRVVLSACSGQERYASNGFSMGALHP